METIRTAAVIGAGTMGAGIAAHLASAGLSVILLDLPGEQPDSRNRRATEGIQRAAASRPSAFLRPERIASVEAGNTEDHFARLAEADWIVEAVAEHPRVKAELWARVEAVAAPHALLSSNSSGIPISVQGKGLQPLTQRRLMGTHFFNPVRFMHLLEVIPGAATDRDLVQQFAHWARHALGKGVVIANDVPGFAANRVGVFCSLQAMRAGLALGLGIEEVDLLTGPLIGRPKSATFRTADLVGLDVVAAVARGLAASTGEDFTLPSMLERMLEQGLLGSKSGGGFYRKQKGGAALEVLHPDTLDYTPARQPRLPELREISRLSRPEERVAALLQHDSPAGEFTRRSLIPQLSYAASKVGEVTETAEGLDDALRWGFGWQVGPLGLATWLGPERLRQADPNVHAERFPAAPLVRGWRASSAVSESPVATLRDMGEGVALLEFHSKANAIGDATLEFFQTADALVRKNFCALVVGNEGEHFCAGADLHMLLGLAEANDFEAIRQALLAFGGMTSRLRSAPYPVIVAPHGQTLGGGCEVLLWGDAAVASAELYAGLVETGVGLLPAGGGCTELLARWAGPLPGSPDAIASATQSVFGLIAQSQVSTSAFQARAWKLLRDDDEIVLNPDERLASARRRALQLLPGYVPPGPRQIPVGGEAAREACVELARKLLAAGSISEFDLQVAEQVATVLAGGRDVQPGLRSEAALLELEREAFLHLCGQPQTRARLAHTLQTGKPLRN